MTSPEHVKQVKSTSIITRQKMARIHNNAAACSKSPVTAALCKKTIHIGIFFDGTDNNMQRDSDEEKKSYTNIVSLYNAYEENTVKGYYKVYVPGVGTEFKIGGEEGELEEGKSNGEGGGKRIYYAMFQVLNIVNFAVNKKSLISDKVIKSSLVSGGFPNGEKIGLRKFGLATGQHFLPYIKKLSSAIRTREPTTVIKAIKHQKPIIEEINISVFGFSRGAAQARAFVNVFHMAVGESGFLCGIKTNFNFLGLFETVASVGIPASTPVIGGKLAFGLTSWADETMKIHDNVKRCVHFVGAHEIRVSFPLSSIMHNGDYPNNSKEVVYPGVHSDIGGGYTPGDQGKSIDSISNEKYQGKDTKGMLLEYNYKLHFEKALKRYKEVRSPDYVDAAYSNASSFSYYGWRYKLAIKQTEEDLLNAHKKWLPLIEKNKKRIRTIKNRLKLSNSRQSLISQVPLRHMYEEAYEYVLPLMSYDQMKVEDKKLYEDFKVNSTVEILYNDYIKLYNKKITNYNKEGLSTNMRDLKNIVLRSQELYFSWRWHMISPSEMHNIAFYDTASAAQKAALYAYSLKTIKRLKSYSSANRQEQIDLEEGNKDYILDMWEIIKLHEPHKPGVKDHYQHHCRDNFFIDGIAYKVITQKGSSDVPLNLCRFFDEYVHDSHSSFYIAGPRSAFERQEYYVKAKSRVELVKAHGLKNLKFDLELLKSGVDNFPLMTDAKGSDLRTILAGATQYAMSKKKCRTATRREAGGHVKERLLMDSNKDY